MSLICGLAALAGLPIWGPIPALPVAATFSGSQQSVQQPQPHVWRKTVAPGVVYVMSWDNVADLTEFAMRIDTRCPDVKLGCSLAGGTVYEDNSSIGRGTVSSIVKANQALGGVNGDFFPFTGDPLNFMVSDGELLSLPYQPSGRSNVGRAVFAWGTGKPQIGYPKTKITLTPAGSDPLSITGFDEEGEPDTLTLDNRSAGLAYSRAANSYAILKVDHDKWQPNDTITGEVLSVGSGVTKKPIDPGTAWLVGQGNKAAIAAGLKIGQKITISIESTGLDWSRVKSAIGGAPMILKDGKTNIDAGREMLSPSFVDHTHPRTAVGYDGKGNIWIVAVDGRTKVSKGVTLPQLAAVMKDFGCTDAINLDGGGSTTFNLFGLTLNHPSDGVERPVANGLLVYSKMPSASTQNLSIEGSKDLQLGKPANFRVFRSGTSVPNADVLWQADGAGWMDQAGVLHTTRTGQVTIHAVVAGKILTFVGLVK